MADLKGKDPGFFDAALTGGAKTAGAKPSNLKPLIDGQPGGEKTLSGKIVGKYKLGDRIGKGAFGEVYLAEHTILRKKIAVKIHSQKIREENETHQRFLLEAQLLAGIKHKNIVSVTDFGTTDDDRLYLVMDYLEGKDLASVLSQEKMSLERALNILSQICSGLVAAHKKGVVHRDIKPKNIMLVEEEGVPDIVKIIDFGIAKVIDKPTPTEELTQAGMVFGTPRYMSPEQVEGKPVDQRSDVYAVGVIFYEMLCGKPPFDGEKTIEVYHKICYVEATPPSNTRPGLLPEIDQVILKAMAKNMNDRYNSMEEFAAAIAAISKKASEVQDKPAAAKQTANLRKPDIKPPDASPAPGPKQTAKGGDPTADPRGETIAAPGVSPMDPQERLKQMKALQESAKEDAKKLTEGPDLKGSEADDSGGRVIEVKIKNREDKTLGSLSGPFRPTKKSKEMGIVDGKKPTLPVPDEKDSKISDGKKPTLPLDDAKEPAFVNGKGGLVITAPTEILDSEHTEKVKAKPSYRQEVEAGIVGAWTAGIITLNHPGIIEFMKKHLSSAPIIGHYISSIDIQQQIKIFEIPFNYSDLVAAAASVTILLTALFVEMGWRDKKKGENK